VDDLKEDARGALIIAKRELYYHVRSLRLILFGAVLSVFIILFALMASSQSEFLVAGTDYYAPDAILFSVSFIFGLLSAFLAVILAYDDMTRERVNHSLELLLVKPVSYSSIVLGKFLGTFFAMALPITIVTLCSVLIISLTSNQSPTVAGTLGFLFCILASVAICILMQQTLSMVFKTSSTSLLVGIIILVFFMMFWQMLIQYIATALGLEPNLLLLPEGMIGGSNIAMKQRTEAFMEWIALLNPFPSLGFSIFINSMGIFLVPGESFVSMPRWLPPVAFLLWLVLFFAIATVVFKRLVRKL